MRNVAGMKIRLLIMAICVALLSECCLGTATIRSRSKRWTMRTVYYQFTSQISHRTRTQVRNAMDRYEGATCLHFIESSSAHDYIRFTNSNSGCFSTDVGRKGGAQDVNLAPSCTGGITNEFTVILHEIGHAIGLYHEQQRPDRDRYVRVLKDNIQDGKEGNFRKRSWSDIDTQGLLYDYVSIMHYGNDFFSENGDDTLESISGVSLGPSADLTNSDILAVNRMYNCPAEDIPSGHLIVTALSGHNFPDKDGCCFGSSKPDSYVTVEAVDANGWASVRRSSTISNDNTPNWNQDLNFGAREWQFFRVRVLDSDGFFGGNDDVILHEQIFTMRPGTRYIYLCKQPDSCSYYARLKVSFTVDSDECSPNPCMNGGTCIDGVADYTCRCPRGFTGDRCERSFGALSVFVDRARNLPDKDGLFAGDSDPYVQVTAYDRDGRSYRLTSRTIGGNHNPVWSQNLFFGFRSWSKIVVKTMDDDSTSGDDTLLPERTYYIGTPSTTPRSYRLCDSSSCGRYLDFRLTYSA